jgi:hypothetical protein
MNTGDFTVIFNASNRMGAIGMSLINAALLAGLPLALIAIIVQAF